MNILLVEPSFPYPNKSKHKANEVHKNFVPIGLLKLGSYYKDKGSKVKLVRGSKTIKELNHFQPDKILITSLFTYWSKYVWDAVKYYRELFPNSEIVLGGIYVTLHYDNLEFKKLALKYKAKCHVGLHSGAERFLPNYSLINGEISHHTTHIMRGCIRRCKFCGVWKLEPKMINKNTEEIIKEIKAIGKNKVIFYDNNFLANPNIKKENMLEVLADLRIKNKPVIFESQSGFDGRLLEKNQKLACLLKKARFQNVRIAWDNGIEDAPLIKKQINYLVKAGYPVKDISIFMIYNFNRILEDMIAKHKYCLNWGVQILDCRYRPLDTLFDDYKPHAWRNGQTAKDYYIHEKGDWSDNKIRKFRSLVRVHNIFIRYIKDKKSNFKELFKQYRKIKDIDELLNFMSDKNKMGYNKDMERWSAIHNTYKFFNLGRPPQIKKIEKNKLLKERIKLLNSIKVKCKGNKELTPPSLDNPISKKADKEIKKWFLKYNKV